jgi:extracellular elastinolytic metalloproteinase
MGLPSFDRRLTRRRSRRLVAATAAAVSAVALGLTAHTSSADAAPSTPQHPSAALTALAASGNYLFDQPAGLGDVDNRAGALAPSSAQRRAVTRLGAVARWNRFGTPESLVNYRGWLGRGTGTDAAHVARSWLAAHAGLFRLTRRGVAGLQLVNNSQLPSTPTHVVLFRQRYGPLPAGQDGLITVAVRHGMVGYVSSSATGARPAPLPATLSPVAAWLRAAANVGRVGLVPGQLTTPKRDPRTGWTTFAAPGFAQPQRVRLVAVALPKGGVRAAYETIVLDVANGASLAYTDFVDARTGHILMRYDRTDQNADTETFQGAFSPTDCGPLHPYSVDDATKSINVVASATVVTNDIVLYLIHNGTTVASSDTATSPEVINYAPAGGIDPGVYNVQVCPFGSPTVPDTPPYTYAGVFQSSDQSTPSAFPYPPKWQYFANSPHIDYRDADNRIVGCWVTRNGDGTTVPGCDRKEQNLASRAPWDHNVQVNSPTFTTLGNNASTAEAWTSPLTPGPFGQRPVAPDRNYSFDWTDQWNNSKCDPASFSPSNNRNDIDAAVTNLFSGHNRFHDFAYHLGFTEDTYNAQLNNFGNTAPGPYPAGREGDPEIGNVEAGALDGGYPTYEGRDNANQIALNDGIPPITNQYLFQPIAGSFYAACTDGDFDTSVFGHEYTHLISNRMVGGPDDSLTGLQAGAMGESWSDQDALEYLHEYGYVPQDGANPWAEGPYVTGNPTRGIRNYALNHNPLNYSDIGYDTTGPEVHADGEIWNAVAYDLRQAFVRKYNARFAASNAKLQFRCAQGVLPADRCPGNRRWIQLVYDAFLLQQGATSMLDARDAYLAADRMRFGGADQQLMWQVFAKRGMGAGAKTNGTDDDQPTPSFRSLTGPNARFVLKAADLTKSNRPAVKGTLYVGDYQARVTPIADTDPATPLPASFAVAPGRYRFLFQAKGYGMRRFTQTFRAGQTATRTVHLAPNLASAANGATATGSAGSINTDGLLDDSEATNWAALGQGAQGDGTGVDAVHPYVTVKLAGTGPQMVRSVLVSALLRPAAASGDADPTPNSRFTALRQFRVDACTASAANGNCTTGFHTIYTSPANAFPAGLPRPLAPDETLRRFDVPDTMATHLRLVALQNQCTGTPAYQGEQDNDPTNPTDCDSGSDRGTEVRAAEFEAYSYDSVTRPPGDPVVVTTMSAPATARSAQRLTYRISYRNLGPHASAAARLTDQLPVGLRFVSASGVVRFVRATRSVAWRLGTVAKGATGTVTLVTRVGRVQPGTLLANQAQFSGADTVSAPAVAATTILP